MPSTDDYRRVFERLRQQGELDVLIALLREEQALVDRQMLHLVSTTLITDAQKLAELHALQGKHAAFARLLVQFKELGTPTSTKGKPLNGAVPDSFSDPT